MNGFFYIRSMKTRIFYSLIFLSVILFHSCTNKNYNNLTEQQESKKEKAKKQGYHLNTASKVIDQTEEKSKRRAHKTEKARKDYNKAEEKKQKKPKSTKINPTPF